MKNITLAQQIKAQIQQITHHGQSIERKNDISGSMVKLNQGLKNLKPLMDKQSNYIKNFVQSQTSDLSSKQSQTRRYLNRIYDIAHNQFRQLLDNSEMYFNIDVKKNWGKIKNQTEKELQGLRDKHQQGNLVDFLFCINNARDNLLKDFLKSLMYRKRLLMSDLNLSVGGYIHGQKSAINDMFEAYLQDLNYIPTKPFFKQVDLDSKGRWTLIKNNDKDANLSEILRLLNEQIEQIFGIVRNYACLNSEQSEIQRNEKIVTSLREQIEKIQRDYRILDIKYRETITKEHKSGELELRDKLKQSQDMLEAKQGELKKLKFEFKDSANQINSYKQKIKSLEEDLQKVTNLEMNKLNEIEANQTTLVDELQRITKIINNFGKMFELESDDKKSLGKQIINKQSTIEKLSQMLGKQKNKNSDLQMEVVRLNQIILELGARINSFKQQK